tara:strand:- start:1332 stop:1640 length:309 start_codon:yes stop_codon:yes gene_type:complete
MEQANITDRNPTLDEVVKADNNLKNLLIQHVGEKLNPEDKNITIEMVIEVMADEFPELVMTLAEENWIRGYQQGLDDVHVGKSLVEKENEKQKSCKLCEDEK